MISDIKITTSALDTSTEKDIQKALQNLVQGRSSLSIAHRLSVSALSTILIRTLILLCYSKTIASADLCVFCPEVFIVG
jgi:ABC-type transport system involved in Fe-S cluster assembly fused permease/ATPase subunit